MSVFILSFLYDSVYVYIVWFEYFISSERFIEMYFIVPDRAQWKNSLVLNVFLPCINIFEKKTNSEAHPHFATVENLNHGSNCYYINDIWDRQAEKYSALSQCVVFTRYIICNSNPGRYDDFQNSLNISICIWLFSSNAGSIWNEIKKTAQSKLQKHP